MSTERAPFRPRIRSLAVRDLDQVMAIERAAYPFPWTRGIFEDCIRVGYDCHGLWVGSLLCGYSVQTQVAGESHLLNLCIEPSWQQQGLGSVLLEHAMRLARSLGCVAMFLEVRPSNQPGIALYQRNGFEVIGTRRDYYRAHEGREDAFVMHRALTSQTAAPSASGRVRDPF